jgi:hypothetical protein
MKSFVSGLVVLALSLGAGAQEKKDADGGDKIGKDKAPVVARKALAEIQKKKGCAIAETNQVGLDAQQQPQPTTFEGILRKDFAAVKGTAEVYAKGATYLVNTGGRFDPPEEVQGLAGAQAATFKNPSLILKELEGIVSSATFGGDETVDGKDCKVVDLLAGEALIKQHLKEIGERANRRMRGFGGGFGGGGFINLQNALDEKQTMATYRVCVGKDDLLVYRVEFVIRPKLKPNSLPKEVPADRFVLDQKIDVKLTKWDAEPAFDIPGVIKTKWALK